MHGVRYTKGIGDGDSSVLHNIRNMVLSYGRDVDKVECANYIVKGYRSKSVIVVITYSASRAIWKHSETNNVMQDSRAGPKHYLGYHESCNSEWCSEVVSGHPRNMTNVLFEMEWAGDRLVNKAHQLIGNKTTNLTKCFTVADTGGLQWFQLKPPLKITRAPNLFTIRAGDDSQSRVIHSVLY